MGTGTEIKDRTVGRSESCRKVFKAEAFLKLPMAPVFCRTIVIYFSTNEQDDPSKVGLSRGIKGVGKTGLLFDGNDDILIYGWKMEISR